MTQTIAWPVLVDMELVRKREKLITRELTKEFDWLQALLDGTYQEFPTCEDQEGVRTRLEELTKSDEIFAQLPMPSRNMHETILIQTILDELFGFGPLGPVLRDPSVRDIWVNGPDNVVVERDGHFEKASVHFENEEHLLLTITKVVKPLGLELNDANPAIQAFLPNGSLVIAALPPPGATQKGAVLVFRAALKN